MNPSWYDVLGVREDASADDVRRAWREADLDPSDPRFRAHSQAAEILLDPERRAAYDAQLAEARAAEAEPEAPEEPAPRTEQDAPSPAPATEQATETADTGRRLPVVPGWLLVGVAALLAVALGVTAWLWFGVSSPAQVDADTRAAQAAAERAIVPILSYDYRHMDQSKSAAEPLMTTTEQGEYDKLFAVLQDNAPSTQTVVTAQYVASGVVRSGTDRVDVLVFVDQKTTNKRLTKPVTYRNQATLTMEKVGSQWLVDHIQTSGPEK